MIWDVIVIGGGPSGLFAAAGTAAGGLKTCLIEANKQAGKKLLITGQGKCNITNTLPVAGFINSFGSKKLFVRKCLYAFSNTDLIEYFSSTGLELSPRPDGKVFPTSGRAEDVLNHLLRVCKKSDTELIFNCKITSVEYENGIFRLFSDFLTADCRSLVIATGGFTYPSTGSDGSGWALAKSLGHRLIEPHPALTGIVAAQTDYEPFSSCSGISLDCEIKLFRDNSKKGTYFGRVLFTHKGLSGPLIIDNSRDFIPGDEIRLNLLNGYNYDSATSSFVEFCADHGRSGIKAFFTGLGIPDRLVSAVINNSRAAAEPLTKAAEISAADRKLILCAFTSLTISISALEGKNHAMCTAGGIDTTEINPATMESRIIPGLYFTGEVMDVDGDSGGFNLQFAFSSASAASNAIIEAKNKHIL